MTAHQFIILAIFCFIITAVILVVYMLIYMYVKNLQGKKKKKWANMINSLITEAIFFEGEESDVPVTDRLQKTLNKVAFRKLLTNELMNARKNVSGVSSQNIQKLYLQLNLEQYALAGLKSYQWHIKTQAIQELSVMGLSEYGEKLYELTNDDNYLVRMEAQLAVVKFSGFEGLRFLDAAEYPVNEWQQVKLLQELQNLSPDNFTGIENWLRSANETVVIFALKLVQNYHRFELYNLVADCLDHPDPKVKSQTIITLGEIYEADTTDLLIGKFLGSELVHQLAILKVFQQIATDHEIPFLVDQLNDKNPEIVLQSARALAKIGTDGVKALTSYVHAEEYPLNEIIKQVKSELAI